MFRSDLVSLDSTTLELPFHLRYHPATYEPQKTHERITAFAPLDGKIFCQDQEKIHQSTSWGHQTSIESFLALYQGAANVVHPKEYPLSLYGDAETTVLMPIGSMRDKFAVQWGTILSTSLAAFFLSSWIIMEGHRRQVFGGWIPFLFGPSGKNKRM
jgi:hypothetical protein